MGNVQLQSSSHRLDEGSARLLTVLAPSCTANHRLNLLVLHRVQIFWEDPGSYGFEALGG